MSGNTFASGRGAIQECPNCRQFCKYEEMKPRPEDKLRVCPDCYTMIPKRRLNFPDVRYGLRHANPPSSPNVVIPDLPATPPRKTMNSAPSFPDTFEDVGE